MSSLVALRDRVLLVGGLAAVIASCATRSVRRAGPGVTSRPHSAYRFLWSRVLTTHNYDVFRPQEFASATIDDRGGRVFVGSASGLFYCLSAGTGRTIWKLQTDGAISSQPLFNARLESVFFGSDDGHLYAVSAKTGEVRWKYATKGTVRKAPAYDSGVLYFVTSEERLYAVEARSGRWRWHYERKTPDDFTIEGQSAVTLARGRAYVGFADGVVAAVETPSGELLWLRSVAAGEKRYLDAESTPIYDPKRDALYVSGHSGGIYALDPDDGTIRWRHATEGVTGLLLRQDRLYATTAERGVLALDLDGKVVWHQTLKKGVPTAPKTAGRYLFVATAGHGLYSVARRDGRLLSVFAPGGGISAEPLVTRNRIYFLSNNGWFYAAELDKGN